MRIARLGPAGAERPCVVVGEDAYVDVSDVLPDVDESTIPRGFSWLEPLVAERTAAGLARPLDGRRRGAPVARPHQILCVGLNYRDHAAEIGAEVPAMPLVFSKAPNTIVGPDDDVRAPRGFSRLDWEVELALVVGRRTSYLGSTAEAREHVAGFMVHNDVSERAFQDDHGGQILKGKSAETFSPCGPWLVTPDEVPDVLALGLWLDVDGTRRQTGSTATMVLDPFEILVHLSRYMVLEPGDVLSTGTPPGVANGMAEPAWLQPGSVMTLGVEGLGTQRQRVVAPR
ncbi:2-keto-4-pentenoate hydratase/2-oxohepta-3-ene-1,7-dioic acid hydratase in catechol pathway [Sediminihabitans luteus]|uniref:2-keto-4-pentenoate hydratase/2-oxohepta-3-ene-1,7-dioic acid hydratase in catechol pathway n=1 Tax=Sediminihabitans luteus TaxID=1138585 RepID=A0A2M9D1L3_9CELL|nr:fumarylacetoacetate hydrolase family protein [Sediminihabitans luteus]PJJ77963.1 2-keto-4-pentenoate hydratase/2-oxohepta-3-ene-1,7-dioic acid hydratase in catechol pathway [Sediminihabitans luteus]GIJ00592.1 2-hydroxyhepta-2,4-diene-1,7-dioate isomerase [Sediminihabitans luteus]